jgi:hypothetical protein
VLDKSLLLTLLSITIRPVSMDFASFFVRMVPGLAAYQTLHSVRLDSTLRVCASSSSSPCR